MSVLKRNEKTLRRTHEADAQNERERQPHQHMEPERPTILHLYDERGSDDDEPHDENDEGNRTITTVLPAEGLAAIVTARSNLKEATEEMAAPTARAAALQPASNSRWLHAQPAPPVTGVVTKCRLPPHQ